MRPAQVWHGNEPWRLQYDDVPHPGVVGAASLLGRPRLCAGVCIRIDILAKQQNLLEPLLVKILHLQHNTRLQLLAVKVKCLLCCCISSMHCSNIEKPDFTSLSMECKSLLLSCPLVLGTTQNAHL